MRVTRRNRSTDYREIDAKDQELIDAAVDVIRRNYTDERHTVGAAIQCSSGKTICLET